VGVSIGNADAWIAATALDLEAPLLTHNRKDFAAVPGLTVISHAN
jgi:predicted nucleic acid-binding protein